LGTRTRYRFNLEGTSIGFSSDDTVVEDTVVEDRPKFILDIFLLLIPRFVS